MNNLIKYYIGIGKRKTSIAKIFLKVGSGNIKINNKTFEQYFSNIQYELEILQKPFVLLNIQNLYDIDIQVKGGGIISQIYAIRLAISRALLKRHPEYRIVLKKNLFLRRDSRIKERRKYGLKKARKASQYTKR